MRPSSIDSDVSDQPIVPDALEPIAIVGLANRFPQQASNTQDLWELLLESRSTWSSIPRERFNSDAFYHPDPEHGGTFQVQGGNYLFEDPAYFDASFFNITKSELLSLDPQQRLVMENVYHALENAGIPMSSAVGSNTSVFVSGFNHDYLGILNSDPETSLKYKPTGVTNAILSNRVSWFFDFKGPSMTIDTACSSSLVALHLAVQSLRSRETDMAIVSGVSILKNPVETIGMSHHGLLGPQGRSFSFDSRAEGYARGEGVGTVVLKPLHSAIRDGDSIRAVIRETGVNQDGRTSGITVPSSEAQERLIREVYWRAGLDVEATRFVEAHGTGTSTGDPIEAGALARAFKCRRDTPLYIGAIKSSIGHLEGGSGVAGIIKAILTLESGIITPNYDMKQVNPKIPATEWGISFPTENIPWPSQGLRRVSVNSFGIGGTNAHCILDDAYNYLNDRRLTGAHCTAPVVPTKQNIKRQVLAIFNNNNKETDHTFSESAEESDQSGQEYVLIDTPSTDDFCSSATYTPTGHTNVGEQKKIFVVSAFDEDGVKRNADALSKYLKRKMQQSGLHVQLLDDLSFTLSKKRSHFYWKSYVMASSIKELAWSLSGCNYTRPIRTTQTPIVQFVFTGQGAQYQAMGRELMIYPIFRESLEEASDYIRRLGSPWSLLHELLTERTSLRVNLPEVAHPLCTALQVALVDLLASWGIFPTQVIGHSSGEIAAAYCSGKLSREAAWKVAYLRGYVSSKQLSANGAMMAVGLSVQRLEPYLKSVRKDLTGELVIACQNSPKNNTVSGDEALIDCLKDLLDDDAVFARKLNVKNAYHSAHMQAIADDYLRLMGTLLHGRRLAAPHPVQMFSTVTGKELREHQLLGQYWVENMVSPVLFTTGLAEMTSQSNAYAGLSDSNLLRFLVEIGPHSTLQSAIKESLISDSPKLEYKYSSLLKRTDQSLNNILTTVGCLSANGYELDFHAVNKASQSPTRESRLLVELPPYSFKHTEKILYESRLSRNLRTRKFPRHDLFGAPSTDWNPIAPRWRHFIRIDENPWLRDHVVTGNHVYPGVGYLIMAIEASRQLAGDEKTQAKITGFHLRRVSMKRALIVPDTKEGIEVSLSMATVDDFPSTSKVWRHFHITSYNTSSDEWTEHCTGQIMVEHESAPDSIDVGREAAEEIKAWKDDLAHANQVCNNPLNFKSIYSNLHRSGLAFGPLFQNLSEVHGSGLGLRSAIGSVVGSVIIPDIAQHMPKQFLHSHLIHPATMDSMIHLMIAAVIDYTGNSSLDQIRLPTFIRDVWVSAGLNSAPSHIFTGHASISALKSQKFEGQIRILDAQSSIPRIRMDGIELTPLESSVSQTGERKLCTTIEWKPDVHFLDSDSACGLTTLASINDEEAKHWVKQLQLATMIYVTDALTELKNVDFMKLDNHMRRFVDWMKFYQQLLESNEIIHLPYKEFQQVAQDPALREAIDNQIESHSAEGAITARMGRNIVKVIRQEVDPLHLMFGQDDVMEQVYKEGLHLYNLPQHLQSHLSLLRHQHSELKILEIGGGTGSFTAEVLAILCPDPGRDKGSVASYTFTDISSGFFEKAKQRFQPWANVMDFQSLNIERNPVDQGLQLEKYDLILAGNVIHATANLQATLQNLRSLLRPGGQLIMQEGIRQDFLWYPLVFGQLPGWWLGDEPNRRLCPYIASTEWYSLLRASGFSGIDIEYPSSHDPDLTWQSILVSSAVTSAVKASEGNSLGDVIIMTSGAYPKSMYEPLESRLRGVGYTNVLLLDPSEVKNNLKPDCLCISLLDLDFDYLEDTSASKFETLKEILTKCHNILWVKIDSQSRLHSSMSLGLLRSLRWERDADGSNIVILTVADDNICLNTTLDQKIGEIVKHQFVDTPGIDRHAEYLIRDGITHIGRLQESDIADQFLASQSSGPRPSLQRIGHIDQPIQLQESETGDFGWVIDQQHEAPMGANEVEIYTQAVGLSSAGLSKVFSNEVAGFVTRIGCSVIDLSLGDRVACISANNYDCFRTNIRVDQGLVAKIPTNITFETAASLPVALLTAEFALNQSEIHASGNPSDPNLRCAVLVHDGMAPASRAVIQGALDYGAVVYVCVATVHDRIVISSQYEIPEHQIFSNRDSSFSKVVIRCTNGKGVMFSYNTPSGEAFQETLKCLSPFGTIFQFTGSEQDARTTVDLASLPQCASIRRVNIPLMAQRGGDVALRLSDRLYSCLESYSNGSTKEIQSVTVMDFSQIKEGIQARNSGKGGSIVFTLNPTTLIPVIPQPPTPYQFDSNASYVLAGGYGGLGRSLTRWMASRGARNLIFLSRSSASTPEKVKMLTDLTNMGCIVHSFACDVSDAGTLEALSESTFPNLPPIKGCIQASMVLRDCAFECLSYEDWQAAIKPKVQGSWNLHKTLPKDMDFFVMLSSVAGIFGNRGQSNYAAGNTFQDSLAAHRVSQGLKASSLNLGSVSNVGWVAENRDTIRTNTAPLFELLSEDEVHAAVEFLIDPRNDETSAHGSPPRSQLVLGLPTAEMCRQNGVPAPAYLNYSMFTHFRDAAKAKSGETSEQRTVSTAVLLRTASSPESVVTVISNGIVDRLAALLAIPASEIDVQRFGFGSIDSLVAMEFRSWITRELQAEVSLLDIMGAENIRALSERIAGRTRLINGTA